MPAWRRLGGSRSTGPRSAPTRAAIAVSSPNSSRARSSRRRSLSTRPRRRCVVSLVATSCPRSWPAGRAARAGCAPPASGLTQQRAEPGRPIRRSRPERLREAKRRLEVELAVEREAHAQYEAYRQRGVMKGGRRFGRPPSPRQPATVPAGKVNLSDADSTLVHGMPGWVQGDNAQAACNERHLILAAEVMTGSPDFGHLGPMLTAARAEPAAAGRDPRS